MKPLNFLLLLFFCLSANAQNSLKRALFVGNSYTYFNNLPQLTAQVAANMQDTLVFDSNTPGGYKFSDHNADPTSLAKIAQSGWDYVVLQEQSQLPAFPITQVQTQCFPYAQALNDHVKNANPAAQTVFYMTWGRKNGDAGNCANFAPMCTYNGMDSLLRLRYKTMAADNEALVSPVGAVWRHIRQNFATIELYQSDESHPSLAGSYAGACTFYTVFFRKNPESITYDAGLSPTDAANIRTSVKTIVFDHLVEWNIVTNTPVATESAPIPIPVPNLAPAIVWYETYPNPGRDAIFIKCPDEIKTIEVTDINGKIVDAPFSSADKSLNISQLAIGLYLVTINNDAFAKFVKE
jgi:Secretion system C-terminal sorting domain